MKENNFKNQNYNFISAETSLEGDLTFSGDTIIHGQIKGTIIIKDEGHLIFERSSIFEGTIYCQDIEIFGSIKGTIKAAGTLNVRSSGQVSGNIQAQKLVVYPGALLNIEGHTNTLS
jgi:cytoskeletal protein CcmA (bactofilin family)